MGGQAWLDGRPLYRGDVLFHTPIGLNLPFTYPPLAAIAFCPFAWLRMPAASVAITAVDAGAADRVDGDRADRPRRLEHLDDCCPGRPGCAGCGWRSIIVAPATIWLEPISLELRSSARSTSC